MPDMPREIWALQDPHEKGPFGMWSAESDCDHDTRYVHGNCYDKLVVRSEQIRHQRDLLADALRRVGVGGCWCEKGIGHPLFTKHSMACKQIRAVMDERKEETDA